jgi:hypothetical protein
VCLQAVPMTAGQITGGQLMGMDDVQLQLSTSGGRVYRDKRCVGYDKEGFSLRVRTAQETTCSNGTTCKGGGGIEGDGNVSEGSAQAAAGRSANGGSGSSGVTAADAEIAVPNVTWMCDSVSGNFKAKGNRFMKLEDYYSAVEMYSHAISAGAANGVLYSNRYDTKKCSFLCSHCSHITVIATFVSIHGVQSCAQLWPVMMPCLHSHVLMCGLISSSLIGPCFQVCCCHPSGSVLTRS